MKKKAGIYSSIGTIIVIILGLLVIALIIGGPVRVAYEYSKEMLVGPEGIFTKLTPAKEEEFKPYVETGNIIMLPNDKEQALNLLANNAVECLLKSKKVEHNLACFQFKVDPFYFTPIITETDFKEKIRNSEEAKKADLVGTTTIFGIPKTYYNHVWVLPGDLIFSGTGNFYMCSNLDVPNRIYITKDFEKDCPLPYK